MRISDSDLSYVLIKTFNRGVCFGVAASACFFAGLMHQWSMDYSWVPLIAGIGVYIVGEILHGKAMDRLDEVRSEEDP